jgi:hypothetical protein
VICTVKLENIYDGKETNPIKNGRPDNGSMHRLHEVGATSRRGGGIKSKLKLSELLDLAFLHNTIS